MTESTSKCIIHIDIYRGLRITVLSAQALRQALMEHGSAAAAVVVVVVVVVAVGVPEAAEEFDTDSFEAD